jgi:hypothetical protein
MARNRNIQISGGMRAICCQSLPVQKDHCRTDQYGRNRGKATTEEIRRMAELEDLASQWRNRAWAFADELACKSARGLASPPTKLRARPKLLSTKSAGLPLKAMPSARIAVDFGGYVRPGNLAEHRHDRRKLANQSASASPLSSCASATAIHSRLFSSRKVLR